MPPIGDSYKVVTIALTTGDVGVPPSYDAIVYKNVNIHCYGADCFYGGSIAVQGATQSSATPTCSILRANGVVWFDQLVLKDMFFKSYVNATPAYVVVTGVVA